MSADQVRDAFFNDPVTFAMQNFLICGYTGQITGGAVDVYFQDATNDYGAKRFHGEGIKTYIVSNCASTQLGSFKAFFCPYDDNTLHQVTLTSAGRALFTPRMDGCSFGVGMPNTNGDVTVAHVNESRLQVSPTNTTAMEQAQRTALQNALGNTSTLFEPGQYRRRPGEPVRYVSFTFGVRNTTTNVWNFYAQVADDDLGHWRLRSIKKIR